MPNYIKNNSANYNIIHAHSYHAFPSFYASRNRGKTPFIFTPHYHGKGHTLLRSLLHVPYRILGANIFSNAENIIAVSEYEKKLILENFKIKENKIQVIPNGVNKSEFKDLKKTNKKAKTILSVGRLEEYKGMHHLIKAISALDNDIQLEIVGSGPYENSLRKMINELKLTKRVNIVSGIRREDLLKKYVNADLFALLSKNEAYGITVAEALAAGTPCIVAKTSALVEWVDNKNCFGLDTPINITQLRTLIQSTIGKKAINNSILDWEEVTHKILNVYETTSRQT
jgi:1,2-diacylglycerol 3-alpha-glucosyltransferase